MKILKDVCNLSNIVQESEKLNTALIAKNYL